TSDLKGAQRTSSTCKNSSARTSSSQHQRVSGAPTGPLVGVSLVAADGETSGGLVKYPWMAWLEAASFAAEAQRVVALRMMRLAAGGGRAASEGQRMLLEKAIANAQAQFAACMTLAAGRTIEAAARAAARPYRKTVRANHRRLT